MHSNHTRKYAVGSSRVDCSLGSHKSQWVREVFGSTTTSRDISERAGLSAITTTLDYNSAGGRPPFHFISKATIWKQSIYVFFSFFFFKYIYICIFLYICIDMYDMQLLSENSRLVVFSYKARHVRRWKKIYVLLSSLLWWITLQALIELTWLATD